MTGYTFQIILMALSKQFKHFFRAAKKLDPDTFFYHASTGKRIPFSYVFPEGTYSIVGNSPILLDREDGKEIDQSDYVLRFNDYKTTRYEKQAGEKVSHWVTGAGVQSTGVMKTVPPNRVIFITNLFRSFKEKQAQLLRVYKKKNIHKFILFHSPSFMRFLRGTFQCIPTTGLLTLMLLSTQGIVTSTFGFTFGPYRNRYHYYPDRVKQDRGHHWNREKQIYSLLVGYSLVKHAQTKSQVKHAQNKNEVQAQGIVADTNKKLLLLSKMLKDI